VDTNTPAQVWARLMTSTAQPTNLLTPSHYQFVDDEMEIP
jgi:hypothetical protein